MKYKKMRKYHYAVQMTLIFMFITIAGFGQNIDSMMNLYADRSAPERIHIHFDKNIYNKGETIWYKVYLLQGSPVMGTSKNLYLEWYNADGKRISQTVAPIILSTSSGSFDIPADLKGMALEVRAFTSWMLNDDTAFIYRRQLVISHNTPEKPDPRPDKTTVSVFPEGGLLIQGLNSRVAFKATNGHGDPVLIKGILTEDSNNTRDSIHVIHDGMGSFFFTPAAGHKYQLSWIDEFGATGSTPLPDAKSEGARLMITRKKNKALFSIDRTINVQETFKKMTLVVHMNRVALYQVAINTTEKNSVSAEIPIDDLPTGLLQFTLFTSDWIPVAERVLFINNRRHEFEVTLTTERTNLTPRGKNILDLYVPDTLFTNMSLAVTDAGINTADQHTIFSDLFLSSEIRGKVYNPAYYLLNNSEETAAHLDLVMLTNAWRRFDWDKIKAHIGPAISHHIENEYMQLQGKLVGIKNRKAGELNMIIVNKDSSRQFIQVNIQKDGSFQYPAVFFDTARILFSINNDPWLTEKVKLDIGNGLLQLPPQNILPLNSDELYSPGLRVNPELNELLNRQELNRKELTETTLKEVTVSSVIKTKEQKLDEKYSSGFFRESPAKKAYVLDLTDPKAITSSQTVMEYLMNRIPGLIVNGSSMQWRGNSPVFYLNEIRSDIATISDIPLQHVAMIKAFPPIFMFATGSGAGGAVAVYTKKGADDAVSEQSGVQSVLLAGYTRFKEFYHPDYEQADSGSAKSDTRTTLYWNPNLITNTSQQHLKIEYFNNDFTKSFRVILEGINAAGKMTRLERTIKSDALQ